MEGVDMEHVNQTRRLFVQSQGWVLDLLTHKAEHADDGRTGRILDAAITRNQRRYRAWQQACAAYRGKK
jgi:hypothetical protein